MLCVRPVIIPKRVAQWDLDYSILWRSRQRAYSRKGPLHCRSALVNFHTSFSAEARVLIIDWDIHHGNGTQDIFAAEPRVCYISAHGAYAFPAFAREGQMELQVTVLSWLPAPSKPLPEYLL